MLNKRGKKRSWNNMDDNVKSCKSFDQYLFLAIYL